MLAHCAFCILAAARCDMAGGTVTSPLDVMKRTAVVSCGRRACNPSSFHCAIIARVASTCPGFLINARYCACASASILDPVEASRLCVLAAVPDILLNTWAAIGVIASSRAIAGNNQPATPSNPPIAAFIPITAVSGICSAKRSPSAAPAEWPTTAMGFHPSLLHRAEISAAIGSSPQRFRAPKREKPCPGKSTAITR